jgi:hypothetical protein
MIEDARKVIAGAIERHERPAVMASFGKDSMLLLHLVREQIENVPVIWLGHETTSEQFAFVNRMIIEWDLTLFKVSPASRYVVRAPNGDYSLVREYEINGEAYPVISDLVHSDTRCLLNLDLKTYQTIEAPFDCVFAGWKESDRHPVFGDGAVPFPPDGTKISGAQWYAPLRSMTDEEVWQATKELHIPHNEAKYDQARETADPDNVVACSRCLTGQGRVFCHDAGREIDVAEWDRDSTREYLLGKFFG